MSEQQNRREGRIVGRGQPWVHRTVTRCDRIRSQRTDHVERGRRTLEQGASYCDGKGRRGTRPPTVFPYKGPRGKKKRQEKRQKDCLAGPRKHSADSRGGPSTAEKWMNYTQKRKERAFTKKIGRLEGRTRGNFGVWIRVTVCEN